MYDRKGDLVSQKLMNDLLTRLFWQPAFSKDLLGEQTALLDKRNEGEEDEDKKWLLQYNSYTRQALEGLPPITFDDHSPREWIERVCTNSKTLVAGMQMCKASWEASTVSGLAVGWLTDRLKNSNHFKINKVVCLALGHLQFDNEGAKTDSKFQHLFACDLSRGQQGVPIFAQDPQYCEVVIDILKKQDPSIEVVHDPEALLKIDKSTFVICLYPDQPLLEVIADIIPDGPAAMLLDSNPNMKGLRRIQSGESYRNGESCNTPHVINLVDKYEVLDVAKESNIGPAPGWSVDGDKKGMEWLWEMELYIKKA